MHSIFGVVLSQSLDPIVAFCHDLLQELFVVLGPLVYGQFFDVDDVFPFSVELDDTLYLVVSV